MKFLARVFHAIERFLFYAGLVQRVSTAADNALKAASNSYRRFRYELANGTVQNLILPSQQAVGAKYTSGPVAAAKPAALPQGPTKATSASYGVEDVEEAFELFYEAFGRDPYTDEELFEFMANLDEF